MQVAYLDLFAGAAGDMLVGACLDAGVPFDVLSEKLSQLPLDEYRLEQVQVMRRGLGGTHFRVHAEEGHVHRHLSDIRKMVQEASFEKHIEGSILDCFSLLAAAEGEIHRCSPEEVHFHEVGAVDAIVDICGAVIAFDLLGVERIHASAIEIGMGTVDCAHGTLPVPAPATLELLEGLPVRQGGARGECCTPTGAALLRTLVDAWEEPLHYRPMTTGYGAGTRDPEDRPNLLRISVGEAAADFGAARVWELGLQVDNCSGEVIGHALRRVLDAGALDAWAAPTFSKKNRPAHWVVALTDEASRDQIETLLLSELPTLGLRRLQVDRRTLPRRVETRETALGPVRFKVRTLPDGSEIAHPEADDVEALAAKLELPLPQVLSQILSGEAPA